MECALRTGNFCFLRHFSRIEMDMQLGGLWELFICVSWMSVRGMCRWPHEWVVGGHWSERSEFFYQSRSMILTQTQNQPMLSCSDAFEPPAANINGCKLSHNHFFAFFSQQNFPLIIVSLRRNCAKKKTTIIHRPPSQKLHSLWKLLNKNETQFRCLNDETHNADVRLRLLLFSLSSMPVNVLWVCESLCSLNHDHIIEQDPHPPQSLNTA